jgi:hypothetical protein
MSSPRDRDGFDDRAEDGAGWQEPAHLGDGAAAPDPATPSQPPAEQRGPAAAGPAEPADWPPAGAPEPSPVPAGAPWGGRPRRLGEAERVFRYEGDAVGVQGWAVQHGWTISDGSAPQDAVLGELIATAPVRATKDHRAATVLRGRYGTLELVAFDVVYASGRYLVPQWAVTAAPLLMPPPMLRLSPARFWKHRTGGLMQIPSGNPDFDQRWVLLAADDSQPVRRLSQDPEVQQLLLGTDDGDEFWTAAGHVAAVRPDGHRPSLLEHHARLLAAVVAALTGLAADDQLG